MPFQPPVQSLNGLSSIVDCFALYRLHRPDTNFLAAKTEVD